MLFEKIDKDHCGHLSKDEMQKIELNILKHVIKFCEENNITYFLYGGTLIGAIRHKGFIPWDDDIDIAMPREDYDRFLKTFKNTERYILTHIDIEKDYYLPFAKVYDNYTYLDERSTQRIPMGVYIDIFPIDSYDNSEFTYLFNKLKRGLIHCRIALIKKEAPLHMKVLIFLGRIISFWYPLNKSIHSMEKNVRNTPLEKSKKVGTITEGVLIAKPYPYRCIESTLDWPFEDIIAKVPVGYDEMQTIIYGDYMTPPPEEKRKTAHEKFFSGYKKEFLDQF